MNKGIAASVRARLINLAKAQGAISIKYWCA
jgi:hypothetical protein